MFEAVKSREPNFKRLCGDARQARRDRQRSSLTANSRSRWNGFTESRIPLFSAIVLLSSAASACTRPSDREALIAEGKRQAGPVIEALGRYRAEKGGYPDSWVALVPDYVAALPRDGGGLDFSYSHNAGKAIYVLTFSFDAAPLGISQCRYYSNTAVWSCASKV